MSCEIGIQDTFRVEGCLLEHKGFLFLRMTETTNNLILQTTWEDQFILSVFNLRIRNWAPLNLFWHFLQLPALLIQRAESSQMYLGTARAPSAAPCSGRFQEEAPQLDEAMQQWLVSGLWTQQERDIFVLHSPLCTERSCWQRMLENTDLHYVCIYPTHHQWCNTRCKNSTDKYCRFKCNNMRLWELCKLSIRGC